MNSKTKFSLIEPTIQDLKVTLTRRESKVKQDLEDATQIKLLLLGSNGVGKSSIISRFLFDFFPEVSSLGLEEHFTKLIQYKKCCINLNLVDTGDLVSNNILSFDHNEFN